MTERLEWTDWPAARATGRATLAGAVICATSVGVVAIDPLLGFVGTVLLLVSVTDFMLPTRFVLTVDEVRVRNPLRMANRPWSRLGAWSPTREGFSIAGRSPSKLLRRLRGVELRCPGRRLEVEALLRQHLGPPVGEAERRPTADTDRDEETAVG